MAQFHFRPSEYLELMHREVPAFEELEDQVAVIATVGASRVLELGTGSGETSRRVLEANPDALLVGIDVSSEMLDAARQVLPLERVDELIVSDLSDPLPSGPFDLVFSALAVHHLRGEGKADLFRRVAGVLDAGGVFVLGDVIVPEDPADVVTPCTPDYDFPSSVAEQVVWLSDAGFSVSVEWSHRDLAVIKAVLG